MPHHLLTNFEIKKYYQNEPKFKGVYSQKNLPKIKVGDISHSVEPHWITLHVNGGNVRYFDSFGVKHVPKEIRKVTDNKNITTNTYRIQANNSIILYWIYWFMLNGKSLLDYTILFFPNKYDKNDKKWQNIFSNYKFILWIDLWIMWISIKILTTLKFHKSHTFLIKH